MLGWLLRVLLILVIVRALWRFVRGLLEGSGAVPRRQAPGAATPGVPLVKDPVCGTYVVRERALTDGSGSGAVFFCSERCRDTWRRDKPGRRSA
jgi:YHS domain-containing protein